MNNPTRPLSESPVGHQSVPVRPALHLMQENSIKSPLSIPQKRGGSGRAPKPKNTGEKKPSIFGRLFGGGKSSVKPTTGVAKSTSGVVKSTTGVAKSTTGVAKSTTGVAKSTTGVVKSTTGVAKSTTGVAKSTTPPASDEAPFSLPSKPTESDVMTKRHDELIKSVDEICKNLGKAQTQKVEVSVTDILPPIPAENIDALTRTQVQVTGVLGKVADRLDEAGKRDGLVMESLTQVDGTLSALSRASEQSVTTMDGMKEIFAKVSGSMEAMRSELKKSSRRYETLCEKVQKADQESSETIAKLQKRTLIVTALLGIAVVAGLVIVAMGR